VGKKAARSGPRMRRSGWDLALDFTVLVIGSVISAVIIVYVLHA
jgi:hypothetical protein